MYEYGICTQSDEDIFNKQCAALEKYIDGLKKMKLLQDVDGTLIQSYEYQCKEITVYNDLTENSVWIRSVIDLEPFFK